MHRTLLIFASSLFGVIVPSLIAPIDNVRADDAFEFQLRYQQRESIDGDGYRTIIRNEQWKPSETAVIVCDVWDYHHCLNAVRRLEEFGPRLNNVLEDCRSRGAIIIHAPSSCMDAYKGHPARKRAMDAPQADNHPHDIQSWCSVIPSEERAVYPVDQSDGGEDDDPEEHKQWAKKLAEMGRNPGSPWKKQSDMITIDDKKDYVSDSGEEIWNVLEANGIRNVMLTGVHTNMCVLGRPFGLRQMARNGKKVVLMRDMTDTMYNPKRWPYVSHFEGTRRVISHIERFVCPTISSDQVIGGDAFRFKSDDGSAGLDSPPKNKQQSSWKYIYLPNSSPAHAKWYRCVVRIPGDWVKSDLAIVGGVSDATYWCNGEPLKMTDGRASIPSSAVHANDYNLIVMRTQQTAIKPPALSASSDRVIHFNGKWQYNANDDEKNANIPLPAKFGGSADTVFEPGDPLWVARAVTRRDEFTSGIEGPACDADGFIFAVNFERQGTIGRVHPDGTGEVFVDLPKGSIGNGIRFAKDGTFFVADYTGHNILRIDPTTKSIKVFAHNDQMNQPNDLAMAPNGTLYASDPAWKKGDGQLWRIDRDGSVTRLAENMGTTNGVEVSPDGKILYVNESRQRNVWAFSIGEDGGISDKRLLRKFSEHGFDGMRCDIDGNLYITRHGKGTVVKMSPDGEILREIDVLGAKPSNICFGGPDGRTAYVTQVDGARLVSFRVDRPGRSWAEMNP